MTVVVLLALWAMAAGLRDMADTAELAAQGDRLWSVDISVQVDAAAPEDAARAAVPADTDHIHIIGQRLNHPGWRLRFSSEPNWGVGRQARLVASSAGPLAFDIGLTVRQSATPLMMRPLSRPEISVELREHYLLSNPVLGLEHETVAGEVNRLASGSRSGDELLDGIFSRSRQLLPGEPTTLRTVPEVLATDRGGVLERANVMVALCRAANIPARLVTGLVLTESTEASLHHWVEAYDDSRGWMAYDPLHGYQQGVPHNFLPFVKDRPDTIEVIGAGKVTINYAVTGADEFLEIPTGKEIGWQSVFYLTRLPLETRNVLAHLMLLPLAVLLTTMFRELTGLRSYGTFMPALFTLALVHAEWQMASVTLGIVLLFSVLGRSALPARLGETATADSGVYTGGHGRDFQCLIHGIPGVAARQQSRAAAGGHHGDPG